MIVISSKHVETVTPVLQVDISLKVRVISLTQAGTPQNLAVDPLSGISRQVKRVRGPGIHLKLKVVQLQDCLPQKMQVW